MGNLLVVIESVVVLLWDMEGELFPLANHILGKAAQQVDGDGPFHFLAVEIVNGALSDGQDPFLCPFTLVDLPDLVTEDHLLSVEDLKHLLVFVQAEVVVILLQDLHAGLQYVCLHFYLSRLNIFDKILSIKYLNNFSN